MRTIINQKREATNLEARRNGERIPRMCFFHEPGQWSRPFFNEEATQFTWVELQTSDAQLKRRGYAGFKVGAA